MQLALEMFELFAEVTLENHRGALMTGFRLPGTPPCY
jgi:hypothetical protein